MPRKLAHYRRAPTGHDDSPLLSTMPEARKRLRRTAEACAISADPDAFAAPILIGRFGSTI